MSFLNFKFESIMTRQITYLFLLISFFYTSLSQPDSTKSNKYKHRLVLGSDSNVVFSGTRIVTKIDTNEFHKVEIGGYVSSYYAHYSDEIENNGFVQFPTMAARNDQFGLNIAQIGMQYQDQNFRGNITLHYGDIPESNWPKPFTLIQEAHAGFKIIKNLWLDAGFFKTHIGIESIQPRENVTSSMSIVNFYEPYFLSGAKLTYQVNSKLSVQINAFNGYNEYIENNKNKALGFSAIYDVNQNISLTYNFLSCDETPDKVKTKHERFFHNLYGTFKFKKFTLGLEVNHGTQKNTLLIDTTKTAKMYSGLIIAKYQVLKKIGIYGRGEYFSDKNRILTGKTNLGSYIYGVTGGIEFKPIRNVSFSAEYRLLESENLIFKTNGYMTNKRDEYIICLDVWF
jgi:hypothetical protein